MLNSGDVARPFEIQPVSGLLVRSPAPAQRPLALFFVRALGCPFGRAALARIQAAATRLDDAGLRVLAVTPSPLHEARDYIPRHHLLFPVCADPSGALFDQFGIDELGGVWSGGPRSALRFVSGVAQWGAGGQHGQGRRRAAALLIAPDGRVLHAQVATSVDELPDVDALLAKVES